MSAQSSLENRLVKAQMSLQQLKATQIIGGDNMQCHFYDLPTVTGSLDYHQYHNQLLFIYSKVPFPLVSLEYELWENDGGWVKRLYPYGGIAPYGQANLSSMNYEFVGNESITNYTWGAKTVTIGGVTYNLNDPNLYLFLTVVNNSRTNSTKQYKFDKIKVRCSSLATVMMVKIDDGVWQ